MLFIKYGKGQIEQNNLLLPFIRPCNLYWIAPWNTWDFFHETRIRPDVKLTVTESGALGTVRVKFKNKKMFLVLLVLKIRSAWISYFSSLPQLLSVKLYVCLFVSYTVVDLRLRQCPAVSYSTVSFLSCYILLTLMALLRYIILN